LPELLPLPDDVPEPAVPPVVVVLLPHATPATAAMVATKIQANPFFMSMTPSIA
jgi:hypothetical protein